MGNTNSANESINSQLINNLVENTVHNSNVMNCNLANIIEFSGPGSACNFGDINQEATCTVDLTSDNKSILKNDQEASASVLELNKPRNLQVKI